MERVLEPELMDDPVQAAAYAAADFESSNTLFVELFRERFPDFPGTGAMLDQAERALHTAVNLTTQLLTFSKGGRPVKAPVDLGPVVADAARFALSGSRSELRLEVAPGIELIPAPGHTPGTQAVSVQTEKGKAFITGFCCLRENFEPPEEVREFMPVVAPGIHLNAVDAFESALRIKGLADILVPMHDLSLVGVKSIP